MTHKRRIWKRKKAKKYKWSYNALGRLFVEVER